MVKIKNLKPFVKVGINEPLYALKQSILLANYQLNKFFLPQKSYSLKYLWLMLTYNCNLRCQMCTLWGEKGVWKNFNNLQLKDSLAIKHYKKLITEVSKYQPMVLLTGGEPLLYNNWYLIAEYLKKKNLRCNMSTNGTKIKENVFPILKYIDNLEVSLDGPAAIHNQIRNSSNSFAEIMSGLKKLQRQKIKLKQKKPYLKIVFTISEQNFNYLINLVDFLENENMLIDNLIVRHLEFTDRKSLQKRKIFFKKNFNINSLSFNGYPQMPLNLNYKIIKQQLKLLIKKKLKNISNVSFEPAIPAKEIKNFYSQQFISSAPKQCFSPWLGASVLPNGDIWLCPDYVIGNITQGNFNKFWNGKKAQNLRKILKTTKIFPGCKTCASLYIY